MSWSDLVGAMHAAATERLGQEIFYLPWEGPPYTLQGIPYRPHVSVDADMEATIVSENPYVDVRESDLRQAVQFGVDRDKVRIPGWGQQLYRIIEQEPDGEGMVRLVLAEATTP